MKRETKEQIYTFTIGMIAFLFTAFILIVFSSCSSTNTAADNYIKELEYTLEINGIDIDDTVAGSDAYYFYYENK